MDETHGSDRLRYARDRLGLTGSELAALLEISHRDFKHLAVRGTPLPRDVSARLEALLASEPTLRRIWQESHRPAGAAVEVRRGHPFSVLQDVALWLGVTSLVLATVAPGREEAGFLLAFGLLALWYSQRLRCSQCGTSVVVFFRRLERCPTCEARLSYRLDRTMLD